MRKWNLPGTKLNYLVSHQAVNGEKEFSDQVCQILQKAPDILYGFFPSCLTGVQTLCLIANKIISLVGITLAFKLALHHTKKYSVCFSILRKCCLDFWNSINYQIRNLVLAY